MNQLELLIKEKIKSGAEISFREFMELALYHPQWGYYTSHKPKIGKDGDFYTSPHVGDMFGRMMAKQITSLWRQLGQPPKFYLVEYGAGKGLLARDILTELNRAEREFFSAIRYNIIEISDSLKNIQYKNLAEASQLLADKVQWVDHVNQVAINPFIGCVLSNELLDAFPVHLICQTKSGIKEAVIKLDEQENLTYEFTKSINEEIKDYLKIATVPLADGQIMEVNRDAIKWLAQVATALKKGFIITIDYGYLAQELTAPHRFEGTVLCYEKHQVKENPLENVGNRDITAHVNFSALQNYGIEFGLTNVEYTTQGKFLIDLGIFQLLEDDDSGVFNLESFSKKQKVRQLIMPGGMGDTFKVLIQGKNIQ